MNFSLEFDQAFATLQGSWIADFKSQFSQIHFEGKRVF